MDDTGWDVGVGGVVIQDGRVLLVRYAYGSRQGRWTLPGGYAEQGERLDQAALREVLEETGLQAAIEGVVAVRSRSISASQSRGAVWVGFRMRPLAGSPVPDGYEVDQARYFDADELRALDPVLELSRQVALAALQADGGLAETPIPGASGPAYIAFLAS